MSEANNSEMYDVIKGFPKQCEEALAIGRDVKVDGEVRDITLTGIGGSAYPGDVLKCILVDERDIFINKNYTIPHFISDKSLVIASSFSGNSEETLDACKKALERGAKVVGICKGGKLEKLSRERSFPCIKIPEVKGMQPRNALGYMVIPIINMLQNSGLIKNREDEMKEAVKKLKDPLLEESGKEIVPEIAGKIIATYAPIELYCISMGWVIQRLIETAKTPSFHATFPEATHNDITAYQNPQPNMHTIFFIDKDGNERTKKRMELAMDAIRENVGITPIHIEGSVISKILTTLHMGDWASYHLALFQGTDPSTLPLQETIKEIMHNNMFKKTSLE